jgi:hypothetical protein
MDRHCKTKNEKKTILIWILKPKSFNVQDYTIPNMFELGIVIIVKLVLVYSIITSIIKFMFIVNEFMNFRLFLSHVMEVTDSES